MRNVLGWKRRIMSDRKKRKGKAMMVCLRHNKSGIVFVIQFMSFPYLHTTITTFLKRSNSNLSRNCFQSSFLPSSMNTIMLVRDKIE